MNRDQIIKESIQKLLKMLLEKEKTIKKNADQAAQPRKPAQPTRRAWRPRAPGHSVGLGRENGTRSAPSWAEFGPTGAGRSWPSDLDPTAIRVSCGNKTGGRPSP